jgi:hypothetical protein
MWFFHKNPDEAINKAKAASLSLLDIELNIHSELRTLLDHLSHKNVQEIILNSGDNERIKKAFQTEIEVSEEKNILSLQKIIYRIINYEKAIRNLERISKNIESNIKLLRQEHIQLSNEELHAKQEHIQLRNAEIITKNILCELQKIVHKRLNNEQIPISEYNQNVLHPLSELVLLINNCIRLEQRIISELNRLNAVETRFIIEIVLNAFLIYETFYAELVAYLKETDESKIKFEKMEEFKLILSKRHIILGNQITRFCSQIFVYLSIEDGDYSGKEILHSIKEKTLIFLRSTSHLSREKFVKNYINIISKHERSIYDFFEEVLNLDILPKFDKLIREQH